ncbi:MAG: TonB C-terminal domain-containing protein [Myxococcota bacterium]
MKLSWFDMGLRITIALACGWSASAAAHDQPETADALSPPPAPTADPGAARPPGDDEPEEEEEREVDLLPRVTLAETVGWILVPEPEPSDPEELGERYVDRMIWEHAMQDQLAHIGADGWYHQLGHAVRRSLQVDMNEAISERREGMNVVERFVDELGRFAPGPSAPQGAPGPETAEQRNPQNPNEQWHEQLAEHMNLRNAPVTWHRVDVRVTQAPDGELLALWVIRSSGSSVIDRAVLAAVREGTPRVPPPPQEIVGNRRAIMSEWAVEVGDVATYWTQAGCVMDPEGGAQCAAGGRGITRSRLRLLRVLDEEHPSFEEDRRDRRRERGQ